CWAVELLDVAQGILDGGLLRSGLAVLDVIALNLLPVGQDQLVKGQGGRCCRGRHPGAAGAPLGERAIVGVPALRRAVGAELHVAAAAHAVGQGDDGLAALLVESIRGVLLASGHCGFQPFCRRLPRFARVLSRTSQRGKVHLTCVRQGNYAESGREDLNLRPFGPEPNALAKLSYAPSDISRHVSAIAEIVNGSQRPRKPAPCGLLPACRSQPTNSWTSRPSFSVSRSSRPLCVKVSLR